MRIFGSVEPYIEYNLLSPFWIIFRICQFFETPSFTPGVDRHMCSRTFLDEIQFWTTFIWGFFWCYAYFLAALSPRIDFFGRNSISNNFYWKLFFDAMRIFGSIQPKSCTIILHTGTLIPLCLIMLPSISYQCAQSIYEVVYSRSWNGEVDSLQGSMLPKLLIIR